MSRLSRGPEPWCEASKRSALLRVGIYYDIKQEDGKILSHLGEPSHAQIVHQNLKDGACELHRKGRLEFGKGEEFNPI